MLKPFRSNTAGVLPVFPNESNLNAGSGRAVAETGFIVPAFR